MNVIVQKFGGTSVATEEARQKVIDHIIKTKEQGNAVVVVVSAIGRKGAVYATDTLIRFVKDVHEDVDPRELDLLMSCGEVISSVVLVNAMRARGIEAITLTGGQAGICTDNNYGKAEVLSVDSEKIYQALREDKIPVICGFQGTSSSGDITTLGRGGSDTTASIIGEAMEANRIEVFTDVDGIMTTDPKVCADAQVIDAITYHEVFQMADAGAKVIHPRAVEVAMRSNIPLIIRNTFTNASGTTITRYSNYKADVSKNKEPRIIRSIAHISDRTQVYFEKMEVEDNLFFAELADKEVSIDMINIFPDKKVFTINASDSWKVADLLEKYKARYHFVDRCCKITLIGEKMRGVPGVMARIICILSEAGVKILQTADSHTTISCLISDEDTVKAVNALHRKFKLDI